MADLFELVEAGKNGEIESQSEEKSIVSQRRNAIAGA
jgi:hypothetical protein